MLPLMASGTTRTRLLALEPRLLFDGAGATQVATGVDGAAGHPEAGTAADGTTASAARPGPASLRETPDGSDRLADTARAPGQTLVFIDTRVPSAPQLAQAVAPGVTTVLIDADADALDVISHILLAQSGTVDSIQILSHGAPGELLLGNRTLDLAALQGDAGKVIEQWRASLAPGADILLLGCDLAQGDAGRTFVDTLAGLTGAVVAASTNITGATGVGGDWTLEYATGSIRTPLAIDTRSITGIDTTLDAAPSTTFPTGPNAATSQVLIGTSFNFSIDFGNTGTQTGYGPWVDLFIPHLGQDGVNGGPLDGITFNSATYLGTAVTTTVLTFDAQGKATHPLARDSNGDPIVVDVATFGGHPGDQLVVLQLPFGSFTPGQPVAPIAVNASLSDLANVDPAGGSAADLTIQSRAGFQYGLTPIADWATDPSITSAIGASLTVSPRVYTVSTSFANAEGELATGPDFPGQIVTTVKVAPGQTLSDLQIIQSLPNSVAFLSASASAGTLLSAPAVGQASNNAEVIWDFGNVTGTQSFTSTFYVPQFDANGNPVLASATGAPATLVGGDAATATWTPKDPRDPEQPLQQVGAGNVLIQAKSIATQKTAVTGGAAVPGNTVTYTLDTQISDYFTAGHLQINDTLGDGLVYTPGSASVTFYRGGTIIGTQALADADIGLTANPDGTTGMGFDLSGAIAGGAIAGSGHFGGAQLPGSPATDPTRAVVSFRATIANQYQSPSSSQNNLGVKETDGLGNTERATADLLDAAHGYATLYTGRSDGSGAGVMIPQGAFGLSIYAIDGNTNYGSARITPGDLVTYRLTYTFTANSFDQLDLQSFLPLPIFSTTDPGFTGSFAGWTSDAGPDATPAVGTWKTGPTNTAPLIPTGVTTSASANSIQFQFGSYLAPSVAPQKIDLLFTVTSSATKYVDGLRMTNLGQESQVNSAGARLQQQAIVQVTRSEPNLVITEGFVAVEPTQTNANFVRAGGSGPGGGVSWTLLNALNANTVPFSGGILNTTGMSAAPVDANVTGIDSADPVRFAITVRNTGSSGAYDVGVSQQLDPIFNQASANLHFNAMNGAGTRLVVTDSAGTVLVDAGGAYAAGKTQADLLTAIQSAQGIRLVNPVDPTAAVLSARSPSSGTDVALITFDLAPTVAIQPKVVYTSTATLTSYAGVYRGVSFVHGAESDSATVQGSGSNIAKSLIATDQAFTNGTNVAIGEVLTYQLVVTVREGTTTNAVVTDQLPPGQLALLGVDSITASSAVTSNLGPWSGLAATTTFRSDRALMTLSLGTLTNTDTDNTTPETVTITYRAVVLNALANRNGTTLANQGSIASGPDPSAPIDGRSSTISVMVREPALSLSLTPDRTQAQYGDTVTFTLVVGNTGSTDAWDVAIADALPQGLQNLQLISTTNNSSGSVDSSQTSASALASTLSNLRVGESVSFTFSATVVQAVAFGQTVTNTAQATWTSLPGAYAGQSALNGTGVAAAANTERTGADGPGAANAVRNNFATSASGAFTIFTATPELTQVTSESATPDLTTMAAPGISAGRYVTSNVAIGEIVRYRMLVDLPQSTTSNLQLLMNLTSGRLSYLNDGTATIAFVSSDGLSITSDATGLSGAGLAIQGDQSSINTITPTFVLPATDVTVNGSSISFNLGTVVNADLQPTKSEYVLVEFNAIVGNLASNVRTASAITETFQVARDPAATKPASLASNTTSLAIVEPVISDLGETITAVNGNTVSYSITFSNTGAVPGQSSPAMDVQLVDALSGATNLSQIGNVQVSSSGGSVTGIVNNSTAQGVDVVVGAVPRGAQVTITWTAQIVDPTLAASDAATLTWTSLTGTGTALAGSVQGVPGTSTGERTGSGVAPNTYRATTGSVLGVVQGTVWNDIQANLATTNNTGAPLPGQPLLGAVPVDLTRTSGGAVINLTTTTDANGRYSFGALPAGTYEVKIDPAWSGLVANGGAYTGVSPATNLATFTVAAATTTTRNFGERSPNRGPAITVPATSATYSAGGAPVVLETTSGLAVTDPDLDGAVINGNYGGSSITLARQGGASSSDVFSPSGLLGPLTEGNAFTWNGNTTGTVTRNSGGTLTLTFANGVTQTTVDAVMQAINYRNTSSAPPLSVTLAWTFGDGNPADPDGRQGTGGALTATGSLTLNRVNVAPTLTGLPGTPDSYTEGGTPTVLAPAANVADIDLSGIGNWNGATLTLARHGGANADDLFSGSGTVALSGSNVTVGGTTIGTFTQSGGTLTITFNGNATPSLVTTLARGLAYANTNLDPPASVQIDLVVNDGNAGSALVPGAQGLGGPLAASGQVAVNIIAIDSPPANVTPSSATLIENAHFPFTAADRVSITDPDARTGALSTTLSVAHGTLSLGAFSGGAIATGDGTGTVVITGTLTQINSALASLTYQPVHGYYGPDTLQVVTNDNGNTGQMPASAPAGSAFGNGGTSLVASTTVPIDVVPINTAPSFSNLGGNVPFTPGERPAQLNPNARVQDREMDGFNGGAGNYAGATLSLSRVGGPDPGDVFGTSGTVTITGGNASVNGVIIASVTQVNGQIAFHFNGNASTALVNTLLASLTYQNVSTRPPATVDILYQIDDGNTGPQGVGGALSGTGTSTATYRPGFIPPIVPPRPIVPPINPLPNVVPPLPPLGSHLAETPGWGLGDYELSIQIRSIDLGNRGLFGQRDVPKLESSQFGWPASIQPSLPASEPLRIGAPIGARQFATGAEFIFEIPRDSFLRNTPRSIVNLMAMTPDGQPLPGWLSFDDIAGILAGRAPAGSGPLSVLVIARDTEGNEAQQTFQLIFTDSSRSSLEAQPRIASGPLGAAAPRPLMARSAGPGFTDQLRLARATHHNPPQPVHAMPRPAVIEREPAR